MQRTMLKSAIQLATVTGADPQGAGSVVVDEDLLDAADVLPGEQVCVLDATNGARLLTYAAVAERGSGVVAFGGAAAHVVTPGDRVVLASYATMDDGAARAFRPRIVDVDATNRPVPAGANGTGGAPAGATGALVVPAMSAVAAGPIAETDDAARLDALIQAEA
jgi:aspartate 1-decarboxylase